MMCYGIQYKSDKKDKNKTKNTATTKSPSFTLLGYEQNVTSTRTFTALMMFFISFRHRFTSARAISASSSPLPSALSTAPRALSRRSSPDQVSRQQCSPPSWSTATSCVSCWLSTGDTALGACRELISAVTSLKTLFNQNGLVIWHPPEGLHKFKVSLLVRGRG